MQPELTGKEGERREKGSKVVELRSQGTASSLTEGAAPQFNWRPPPPPPPFSLLRERFKM